MLRRLIVVLILFLLLTGCAGDQTSSIADEPSAVPGVAGEITATATTLPPTARPTATATPEPAARPVVRIQNAETGTYLYEKDSRAYLGDLPASDASSLWGIEDYQGSKRLQNQASGNYLSIEHLYAYVEVLPVLPEWMSPRWAFEGDPAQGSVVIRNLWHNWQVLYVRDSEVHYENVPTSAANARWFIEPLDGEPLPTSTPRPVFVLPTPANPSGSRGAAVPWIEYEAESAETNAEILAPERTFGSIAAESSGRSAVKLDATGEYVQLQTEQAANSIVVRFVIPDSEDGQGLAATLSLYVNDIFRQKIQLTSRYAWSYGGEERTFNIPKAGGAHHFYDESRALVGEIPAGASLRLQKDADDNAEYYVVDLIDLEQVAPPKTQPTGYLSLVEDCGAVPDDGKDDGDAIQTCISRAQGAKTGVWAPAGVYESQIHAFTVSEVIIQGAGMWYTVFHGNYARFNCAGNNCRYFDFAILGETLQRDDKIPENGFNGGAGSGSRLENIWVEHTKVGYWVGGGTNGLIISGSRFRNLFADGVNFCNGTSNSLIENSHFRNTGDDALASWSPKGDSVNTGNVFRFNTVQSPWRANCFAIYGGKDNRIEDNLCADVVTYPGILIAQQFNSNPFDGLTVVQRNSLIRAGGPMFRGEHGALKIWADQGEISGLVVSDLLIEGSTFAGIELRGSQPITNATFERIEIRQSGSVGIYLASNLAGEVSFSYVNVIDSIKEALLNYAPKLHFKLNLGQGNSGW